MAKGRNGGKRSKFEVAVAEVLEVEGYEYEPFKVSYKVAHTYTPDFVYNNGTTEVLVECKGFFRPGDRQKYRAIRDSLKPDQRLVFLLMSPLTRVQKGAKLTMAGWCEKERLMWFDSPKELVEEFRIR